MGEATFHEDVGRLARVQDHDAFEPLGKFQVAVTDAFVEIGSRAFEAIERGAGTRVTLADPSERNLNRAIE